MPNHCSAKNVDQEFFKRVRAAYYVVSGNDPGSEEPSRGVLDALLEGKAQWGSNLQVRLQPSGLHPQREKPSLSLHTDSQKNNRKTLFL